MYHHQLEKLSRTRLDDVLLDEGLLDRESMDRARTKASDAGQTLARVLTTSAVLDDWDLAKIIATHYSLPFIDITDYSLQRQVIETLPMQFCLDNSLIPLDLFGDVLVVAVSEMPDTSVLREFAKLTELTPFFYVGVRRQIAEALEKEVQRSGGRKVAQPTAEPKPKTPESSPKPTTDAPEVGRLKTQSAAEALFASMRDEPQATPTPVASPAARVPVAQFEPVSMQLDASVTVGSSAEASSDGLPRFSRRSGSVVAPSAPAGGASPGPQDTAWESIFDLGDDAVKGD